MHALGLLLLGLVARATGESERLRWSARLMLVVSRSSAARST